METFTLFSLLVFILSILNFIKIILHNELMLVSTNERLMSLDHPADIACTGLEYVP
jgi:hypothetical protein